VNTSDKASGSSSRGRGGAAALIGLFGALIIWYVTPYNNFVIGSSYVADSYLPVLCLFITVLLVLLVNPLLRRLLPGLALDRPQLALIVGILLVACYLPGSGLHRMLPYSLARIPPAVRDNAQLAAVYDQMALPPSLFPDPLGFGAQTPASDAFLTELGQGERIPWHAWWAPCLAWGALMVCCFMMMLGLAMILWPQWHENERLPFPLLRVQQALIEAPEPGRFFAPLFRKRSFWTCAGLVFFLHLLVGLNQYNPERVPAVPLKWNLSHLFMEGPLRYLPWSVKASRIYFIFLGVAFFMPNRIGFSIWFCHLLHAGYIVVRRAYFPPFYHGEIGDYRTGAMLAITAGVLWLGRARWAHVFRLLAARPGSDTERRDRASAVLFVVGLLGMFGWLVWAGTKPAWALFLVCCAFVSCLVVTRIVAETGLVMFGLHVNSLIYLMKLVPIGWLSSASLFCARVTNMLFAPGSRMCGTTLMMHGLGMDQEATPRRQRNVVFGFLALLLVGFVISGAAHLQASYRHGMTLDGREQPISSWGTRRLDSGHRDLREYAAGELSRPPYSQLRCVTIGVTLAGLLEWACLSMPQWPLHPVGLVGVSTWYINQAWVSILIGWLIKIVLVRYGGSRLYHAARSAFIGLIMGEVFAAILWGLLVPFALVMLGLPYKSVQVLPY